MTAILGISALYHDSAATLVVDGQIVAAAQEERFSRKKHDERFPANAVEYCLQQFGITAADLNYVGFYEKPLTHFDRLLETWLAFAPRGYRAFRRGLPLWLRQKLHIPGELRAGIGGGYKGRVVFTQHHESHAASAFYPSPFQEAAILTMDGVGEWATTCIGMGRDHRIELCQEIRFPHSLGLLYSAFTYYTGFRVNSGEYKLMGLAPYGKPIYRDLILNHLIDVKEDGSFRMDMSYFNYCHGLTMTSPEFHRLFRGAPRTPEEPLTQRDMDLAASVQSVTEDIMMKLARQAHKITGMKHLVLAGGVALNCVGNGHILRHGPFEDVWIQPASGDAGGSLGNALFIWHQLLNKPRRAETPDGQAGSLLGPEFSDQQILDTLKSQGVTYSKCDNEMELCELVANLLSQGNVVGWFQGRMEFGPRALGNRSILGDARNPKMQSVMNLKIKFRESFRPFAPVVLKEEASEYFELKQGTESPYMLVVGPVIPGRRLADTPETSAGDHRFGIDRLNEVRSQVPAVTHVDYSARVQTVDKIRNPLLHQLLTAFHQQTGCPVLINTSFNVRSEPIVCTPHDALKCFQMTDMDVLVLGKFVIRKSDQNPGATAAERKSHLDQFSPD
ncbi:MAG: carbamoyltransferase [Planctomycetaceae bacterium]